MKKCGEAPFHGPMFQFRNWQQRREVIAYVHKVFQKILDRPELYFVKKNLGVMQQDGDFELIHNFVDTILNSGSIGTRDRVIVDYLRRMYGETLLRLIRQKIGSLLPKLPTYQTNSRGECFFFSSISEVPEEIRNLRLIPCKKKGRERCSAYLFQKEHNDLYIRGMAHHLLTRCVAFACARSVLCHHETEVPTSGCKTWRGEMDYDRYLSLGDGKKNRNNHVLRTYFFGHQNTVYEAYLIEDNYILFDQAGECYLFIGDQVGDQESDGETKQNHRLFHGVITPAHPMMDISQKWKSYEVSGGHVYSICLAEDPEKKNYIFVDPKNPLQDPQPVFERFHPYSEPKEDEKGWYVTCDGVRHDPCE